jgi:tetratricopeptide (TPR) repeat protein
MPHFDPGLDLELDAFAVKGQGSDPLGSAFDDELDDDELFGGPLEAQRGAAAKAAPPPARGRIPESLEPDEIDFDEDDGGNPGRELSGLHENDLSLIGTYRVAEGRAAFAQETVWKPKDAPAAGSKAASRKRPVPLGKEESQGARGKPAADPFGAKSGSAADPFGPTSLQGWDDDPFEDPFAELEDLSAAANAKVEVAADPFDLGDPFGPELDIPIPSSAPKGRPAPPAERVAEPQSKATGGAGRAESRPPNDRSNPGVDTFFIEAPSIGEGPTPPSEPSGELEFEDLPTHTGGAVLPRAVAKARAEARSRNGRGRQRRKNRGPGLRRAIGWALGLGLVGGGAALHFTEYGAFGLNVLLPGPSSTMQQAAPARPGALASKVKGDTALAYRSELERLEGELRKSPSSAPVQRTLLSVYLDYAHRFPGEFERDPALDARVRELTESLGEGASPRVKALSLLRAGKHDEARIALDQAMALAAEDAELLCLHGDIALEKGELSEARQYFNRALELDPQLVRALYFLGVLAEREAKPDEAAKQFEAALAHEPNHHASMLGLARLAMAKGDVANAASRAQSVLDKAKDGAPLEAQVQARRVLAHIAQRSQDQAKEIEHLEAALALRPGEEEVALELSQVYRKSLRLEDSERVFKTCAAAGGSSPALYREGIVIYLQKDPAEASRLAEEAIDKHPNSPEALFLRGEVARGRGMDKTAKAVFEQVIELAPSYVEAYDKLAALEERDGELDKAEATLTRGLQNVPQNNTLLSRLAAVHLQAGQLAKALEDFRVLVDREPSNAELRTRYAGLLDEMGFPKQAIAQFEQLHSRGFTGGAIALGYAKALARDGRPREALGELDRLIRANPQDVEARTSLARLHIEMGSLKSAETELITALRVQPGHAPALEAYADLEIAAGNWSGAAQQLRRAVEVDGGSVRYRMRLAEVYLELGDSDSRKRAIELLDTVVSQARKGGPPVSADVFVLRGQLRFESGDYRDALEDFGSALAREPSRIDAQSWRGEALYKLKRPEDAAKAFEAVLERDGKFAKAHYYLGQLALARGDRSVAEQHLAQATQGSGDKYADAHKTLGYLYRERGLAAQARLHFERYLHEANNASDRDEVERVLARLR